MSSQKKYKIIAGLLLLVFSLNTVAGFACSIGLDLGYNHHHHEDAELNSHHSHKRHQHVAHYHEPKQMGLDNLIVKAKDDDCCSGAVTKFAQLDKSVVNNQFDLHAPVFLLAISCLFFYTSQKDVEIAITPEFSKVRRSCFLHDTSIRIAIQSFQI